MCKLDEIEIESRAHDELCPCQQCGPPGFGIKNSSRAHDDLVFVFLGQLFDYINSPLDTHGNLDEAHSPFFDGIGHVDGLIGRGHPDHRDEPFSDHPIKNISFFHSILLIF